MSIRLIFSDVDGTILPGGGEISERTKAAVQQSMSRGVPFVISSGRWYITAHPVARTLGIDRADNGYMIIANGGAIVRMDGSVVQEWLTPTQSAWRIYEIMKKYDVMMNSFVRNAIYRVNTQAYNRKKRGLEGYLGSDYKVVNDEWETFEREGLVTPYKMEAYSDNAEAMAALRQELLAEGFSVSSSYSNNMEIMAGGHGKGTAAKWLCGSLGVRPEEAMAFGDNTNDLSMLNAVGWPCAVENAVEELKKSARLIAPPCDQDGVAQIIEKALRGEIG